MILLLTAPRSGSSVTAAILAAHGVWVGECRPGNENNPTGFFENLELKKLQLRAGNLIHKKRLAEPFEGFEEEVFKLNPKDPWLVKTSALYYKLWENIPHKKVLIRRNPDAIKESGIKTQINKNTQSVDFHNEVLDSLDGFEIWPEKFIKGDYGELKDLFEYLGLDFKPEIADSIINPEYWHF